MKENDLERFVSAQQRSYDVAFAELKNGRKRSHWMWYIFPQLRGLGHSYNARYFGIADIEEAEAYLNHPILGERLRQLTEMIIGLPSDDAREIFGGIDSIKLRSSLTLFETVAPNDIFGQALSKFFGDERDPLTLRLLDV